MYCYRVLYLLMYGDEPFINSLFIVSCSLLSERMPLALIYMYALWHRLVPDPVPNGRHSANRKIHRPSLTWYLQEKLCGQLQVPSQVPRRYLALKKRAGGKRPRSCIGCRARLGLPRRRSCNQWLDALKRGEASNPYRAWASSCVGLG